MGLRPNITLLRHHVRMDSAQTPNFSHKCWEEDTVGFCYCFELGSQVAQSGQELAMEQRMTLNFWSPPFTALHAGNQILDVIHAKQACNDRTTATGSWSKENKTTTTTNRFSKSLRKSAFGEHENKDGMHIAFARRLWHRQWCLRGSCCHQVIPAPATVHLQFFEDKSRLFNIFRWNISYT